jgi:hypothetical protein
MRLPAESAMIPQGVSWVIRFPLARPIMANFGYGPMGKYFPFSAERSRLRGSFFSFPELSGCFYAYENKALKCGSTRSGSESDGNSRALHEVGVRELARKLKSKRAACEKE